MDGCDRGPQAPVALGRSRRRRRDAPRLGCVDHERQRALKRLRDRPSGTSPDRGAKLRHRRDQVVDVVRPRNRRQRPPRPRNASQVVAAGQTIADRCERTSRLTCGTKTTPCSARSGATAFAPKVERGGVALAKPRLSGIPALTAMAVAMSCVVLDGCRHNEDEYGRVQWRKMCWRARRRRLEGRACNLAGLRCVWHRSPQVPKNVQRGATVNSKATSDATRSLRNRRQGDGARPWGRPSTHSRLGPPRQSWPGAPPRRAQRAL